MTSQRCLSVGKVAPPSQKHGRCSLTGDRWCTFYALVVIFVRVCGRYVRAEKVFIEDAIMMVAIAPLFIRMGLAHVVLTHGTNNVVTTGLSEEDIRRRVVGSQVVLASRIMYTVLWVPIHPSGHKKLTQNPVYGQSNSASVFSSEL